MTVQVWGSAVALVLSAVLLGQALHVLGLRCRAAGPAVGLGALIIIAAVAIKLPGRSATAAVVLLVVVLAAVVVVAGGIRASGAPPAISWLVAGATLLIAGFGAAIPFIANGQVGVPGVSLDNDTANHLTFAQSLQSPIVGTRYVPHTGYPFGPHSLADAVASGLGVRLDAAFTALLIAIVLITALVGAASLPGDRAWKKPIAGVLAALLYLAAAYYAEGSFKELLMGVFVLAAVLHTERLRADWRAGAARRWLGLLPLSILGAAAIYTYSYVALAWFGLTLVIWVLAEVAMAPALLRQWRARVSDLLVPALIAGGVLVVLLAPNLGRIITFAGELGTSPSGSGAIATSNLGNLAYALSPYEAMGLWNAPDFRLRPAVQFHTGELAAAGVAVLLFGLVWSIRRRELILPAAVAACGLIWWRASHGQSPYVSAKALTIASPVIAVTSVRGLLRVPVPALSRWTGGARLVAAAAFVTAAGYCSYLALRDEPVWASESTNELVTLSRYTQNQPVLFLGATDYADWIFSASDLSAMAPTSISLAQGRPRPTKVNAYGTAYDFDSVTSDTINRFTWFITTNTTYASQPPAGVTLVRRLPMYELWRRTGTIAPRDALDPSGQPGAVLKCNTVAGRRLSRQAGVAAVMTKPVLTGLSTVAPGGHVVTQLRLPPGTWNLSLQYESPIRVEVIAGDRRWRMPAYDDRPGPFFAVGSVVSTGTPIPLEVKSVRPSVLTGPILVSQLYQLAAVSSPDARTLVPMSKACGRYVDWFRLGT